MTAASSYRCVVALVVVAGSLASAGRADDAQPLRWNFQAGQRSRYVGTQDITVDVPMPGRPAKIHSKQTIDMTWVVESVDDDGNAHVVQTITRMRVKGEGGPTGNVDLDSSANGQADGEKPADDKNENKNADKAPALDDEPLTLLVNQPIGLTIDPRGEIVDIELPEDLQQRVKESGSAELAFLLSKDNLKQITSMNTLAFPEKPLNPGDTWKKESDVPDPLMGKQHITTTYRYEGREEAGGKSLDKISASAKAGLPKPPPGVPPMTLKEQTSKGTIDFDHAAGRIERLKMDTKITIEIEAPGGAVRETIAMKLETRLVPEEPANAKAKPAPARRAKEPKRAKGKEELDL